MRTSRPGMLWCAVILLGFTVSAADAIDAPIILVGADRLIPERLEVQPARESEPFSQETVRVLLAEKGRLLAFLEERVGNRSDAEDLLQTTMLRVVTKGRLATPALGRGMRAGCKS